MDIEIPSDNEWLEQITTDSSNEENSLMNVDIETGWLTEEGWL